MASTPITPKEWREIVKKLWEQAFKETNMIETKKYYCKYCKAYRDTQVVYKLSKRCAPCAAIAKERTK